MNAEVSVPHFVALLEGIEDGVIFLSNEGNILFRNHSAAEAIGIRDGKEIPVEQWAEVYGFCWPESTMPFPTKRLLLERVLRSRAKSKSLLWQKATATRPGTLWLVTALPYLAPESKSNAVLLHFHNLSAPSREEAGLRESLERLRENHDAFERFTHMVSHDLREPVRTIKAFTALLDTKYRKELTKEGKEYLDLVMAGADRMQALVEALLAYTRAGAPPSKKGPANLDVIVGYTLKNLALLIRENGATVEVDRLPTVMADARQLARVFQNLIENAIKYRSQAPPKIGISALRDGERWIICVADNGIGIPPEDRQRIFRPFCRLDQTGKTKGTGMGLSIVSRIIESHGGKVRVESKPGQGSRFYLELPESMQG